MRISDWSSDVCSADLPNAKTVFMAYLTQTTQILIGQIIGPKTSKVPQKTIRFILTSYDMTLHHRTIRLGVIHKLFREFFQETDRPVLATHFLTIHYGHLTAFPIPFRNALHTFSLKGFKIPSPLFLTRFITSHY